MNENDENDPLTVLIDAPLPDQHRERIQQLSPDIEMIDGVSAENLQRAQVIYTNTAPFDPAGAPNLRWVQVNTAGIDQFIDSPLGRSGVPLANVRGAYSAPVAELTFAMLLTLTRRLQRGAALQAEHCWKGELTRLRGYDCYGKTMGIVGYGGVGRHIGRIAKAMGMKVLACKRRPEQRVDPGFHLPNTGDPEGEFPETPWFGPDDLPEMLSQSDILVVTAPMTGSTRGLIGKAELEMLPAGAYLISVGRGGVVDESALLACLESGQLAGAGLDVFAQEPLPAESPLWDAPNTVIMPHIGSYSIGQPDLAAEVLIENLSREVSGRPLLNLVDLEQGY